MQLTEQK